MGTMPPRISKCHALVAKGLFLLLATCASQTASGQIRGPSAKPDHNPREIARFFIDEAKADSGYETGSLHIVYNDGTDVVMKLPPLQKSTEKEIVFNDVGFSDVKLAADKQTVAWTIDVENCCTSYPLPLRVVVFRNGHVLREFDTMQMVQDWMFLNGGARIAIVTGFPHGPQIGDYRLYDVKTGKLLSEVFGDEKTQSLKHDAPQWAKFLEGQSQSR